MSEGAGRSGQCAGPCFLPVHSFGDFGLGERVVFCVPGSGWYEIPLEPQLGQFLETRGPGMAVHAWRH